MCHELNEQDKDFVLRMMKLDPRTRTRDLLADAWFRSF